MAVATKSASSRRNKRGSGVGPIEWRMVVAAGGGGSDLFQGWTDGQAGSQTDVNDRRRVENNGAHLVRQKVL